MSIYEVLVFIALVAVAGFAWHLYRQDTRPKTPGGPKPDVPEGSLMFERPKINADRPKKD